MSTLGLEVEEKTGKIPTNKKSTGTKTNMYNQAHTAQALTSSPFMLREDRKRASAEP